MNTWYYSSVHGSQAYCLGVQNGHSDYYLQWSNTLYNVHTPHTAAWTQTHTRTNVHIVYSFCDDEAYQFWIAEWVANYAAFGSRHASSFTTIPDTHEYMYTPLSECLNIVNMHCCRQNKISIDIHIYKTIQFTYNMKGGGGEIQRDHPVRWVVVNIWCTESQTKSGLWQLIRNWSDCRWSMLIHQRPSATRIHLSVNNVDVLPMLPWWRRLRWWICSTSHTTSVNIIATLGYAPSPLLNAQQHEKRAQNACIKCFVTVRMTVLCLHAIPAACY